MDINIQIPWSDWEVIRVIGKGGFGTVYEIHKDIFGKTESAALKVLSIPENPAEIEELRGLGYDHRSISDHYKGYLKDIVGEYSILIDLRGHPNIIHCDEVKYVQREDGVGWDIFIKMEQLTPLLKALPAGYDEAQTIQLAKDLCRALICCQKEKIIHRDIKPQNIFIDKNGSYKLGDFGIARVFDSTTGGTRVGTYDYMAPEVYTCKQYGARVDIYSLGLVLYWMMNNRCVPFLPMPPQIPTPHQKEQAYARRMSGEQLPPPVHGSEWLKAIVMKACAYLPEDRFENAQQMLDALEAHAAYAIPDPELTQRSGSGTAVPFAGGMNTDATARAVPVPPTPVPPTPAPQPWQVQQPVPPAPAPVVQKKRKNTAVTVAVIIAIILALLLAAAGGIFFLSDFFGDQIQSSSRSDRYSEDDEEEEEEEEEERSSEAENEETQTESDHAHDWVDSSCTEPAVCSICGKSAGLAPGHRWEESEDSGIRTCSRCGLTEGGDPEQAQEKTPPSLSEYQGTTSGLSVIPFSYASASSELSDPTYGRFPASLAMDGNTRTSWQEGVNGFGVGESITLYFEHDETISVIAFYLGNMETDSAYYANGRPSILRLTFSDGTTCDWSFNDVFAPVTLELSRPVTTEYIQITILGVYSADWADTAISEIIAYH